MKSIIGTVISNKMKNTVTITVGRVKVHPLYKKRITLKKKFHAHDELGAKIGDRVKITETRPLSKTVHFKVSEIIKK